MSDSLSGEVALVTGASRGIGRAIALELAARGAAVAVNYRYKQAEAEEVTRKICDTGRPSMTVQGHVAVPSEARAVVQRVLDNWGRLDILVNNAGITRDRTVRKLADQEWVDVINVNLNGTFYCTSAAATPMIEQGHGHIVNISSALGQSTSFGQANYSAARGGVAAFTKTVALELAKYGITVNAVSPGYTETEMLQAVPGTLREQIKARIPLGRFCTPEEVANCVAFLTTEGDYITGQQIAINGGLCL